MAGKTVGRVTLDVLRKIVAERTKGQGFESIFKELKVVTGGDGDCSCELRVNPSMLNDSGTLHGGVTASLVDVVSTFGLFTTGAGRPGTTIDLNISYLRPVKADEVITITAKTLNCGKTIAFSSVEITKTNGGALVAHGRHTKFVGEPKSVGEPKL